jgi:predicted secreted protein
VEALCLLRSVSSFLAFGTQMPSYSPPLVFAAFFHWWAVAFLILSPLQGFSQVPEMNVPDGTVRLFIFARLRMRRT